jgi:phosphoesterase RecJ-like protein
MKFVEKFNKKLKKAKSIVITTHMIPDADGIGSEIGLCMALQQAGKNCVCVNEEPLLDRYKYLDPKDVVISFDEFSDHDDVDLFIVVDTNAANRVGPKMEKFIKEHAKAEILFVDHHPASEELKKEHCIETSAAATGQVVGYIIESMGIEFTKELALPIYTAILIDTSSFRYPTVSGDTHRLIGKLVDTGVAPPDAYNGIYGTKELNHMHLLGTILSSANMNKSNDIAWISLRKEDLEKYGTDIEDTHAFINHLLVLHEIKVACMFRDDGHEVKISFRSSGEIDVGAMARKLGGGGHSHSAATIIPSEGRKFDDVIQETVKKMESIIG